jgi:hypothetical protein
VICGGAEDGDNGGIVGGFKPFDDVMPSLGCHVL